MHPAPGGSLESSMNVSSLGDPHDQDTGWLNRLGSALRAYDRSPEIADGAAKDIQKPRYDGSRGGE